MKPTRNPGDSNSKIFSTFFNPNVINTALINSGFHLKPDLIDHHPQEPAYRSIHIRKKIKTLTDRRHD